MTRSTRKRSKSASPDREIVKTPKLVNEDTTVGIMKLIESKFKELNDSINTKMEKVSKNINTSKSEILGEISAQIADLHSKFNIITNRVKELELKINECDTLRAEINILKEKAEKQDSIAISSEIRINGIPSNKNENLYDVFKRICHVINIPTPNIQTIFRVKNKNNTQYNDGPIIVKLSSSYERNFLMRSFAVHRRQKRTLLTLEHIGLNSNQPIYINENLTKTNNTIMKAASKYKRENKFHAAYSLRGMVFIRISNNDAPLLIKSLNMLDELASNESVFRNDGNENTNY